MIRNERHGRIEVEYYDTLEEATIRRSELWDELRADPSNDQSVLIAQSRNHDWMQGDRTYYSVRWVKPILVPHG